MGLAEFSLGDVSGVFTGLREAITGKKIEDPLEQAKILLELDKIEAGLKQAQIIVNEQEAKHESIFVAGWRPYIGWVGGSALTYNYILQPFIYTLLAANDVVIEMPTLDIGTLMMLITGMLGFGGFRTVEKLKGKASGE